MAIKFRMEQSGPTVKDLEPVIGRKNRVYEVLSRRRPLTLRMIEEGKSDISDFRSLQRSSADLEIRESNMQ